MALLSAAGLITGLAAAKQDFWLYFIPESIGSILIAWLAASTASPVTASAIDPLRGVVKLRFRNREYGRLLAKHLRKTASPEI
ncbi:MAG TPA: hypothetical protein VHR72_01255 [Gemmataceae bacterium]|nr:hypothetical protein [Gemmataceae bacterium]